MPPVYLELDQIITHASLVEKAQQVSVIASVAQEERIRKEMPKISEEKSSTVMKTEETKKIYVDTERREDRRKEKGEGGGKKRKVDIKA